MFSEVGSAERDREAALCNRVFGRPRVRLPARPSKRAVQLAEREVRATTFTVALMEGDEGNAERPTVSRRSKRVLMAQLILECDAQRRQGGRRGVIRKLTNLLKEAL